jgi:FkbM family methyltransferase
MSVLRSIRRKLRQILHPKPVVGSVSLRIPTLRLGTDYGGWAIDRDQPLGPDSVIYSFGVGEDASFDAELINRFGCTVHAFDPTPRSIQWAEAEKKAGRLPAQFVMHGYGLAGHDGEITFFAPENPNHVSHTAIESAASDRKISVPVKRLGTVMRELGHNRIDLLKMDIEGSEYEVIDDLLKSGIAPAQLLIEFHHRFKAVGPAKTQEAIDRLERAGYRLFCIADSLEEYSFKKV